MTQNPNLMPQGGSGYAFMYIGDRIRCYRANSDSQFITRDLLLEAKDTPSFHDHHLANLTRHVNQLFAETEQHAPQGMELAMLKTPDGFFLAWTEDHHDEDFPKQLAPGAITADSPAEEVRRALHLKV